MSKRAERRHHLRRMKTKAKHVVALWGNPNAQSEKWANHLALCSRQCCGNPRKWWKKKTISEEIADLELKEQERDMDFPL